MSKRLIIVDPAVEEPEDESVAEVLRGWPGTHSLYRPALSSTDLGALERERGFDGVVVLGSHISVYDDADWVRRLGDWLQPWLDGDRAEPLLGICFTHQLLAVRAGAEVGFLRPDETMAAAADVTHLSGSRLMPGEHALRVLAIQRWEVKTIPEGFNVVAQRSGCAIDGLEHHRLPIYTFQFHPEGRRELAVHCDVPPEAVDDRLIADSSRLLSGFRAAVAGP